MKCTCDKNGLSVKLIMELKTSKLRCVGFSESGDEFSTSTSFTQHPARFVKSRLFVGIERGVRSLSARSFKYSSYDMEAHGRNNEVCIVQRRGVPIATIYC